MKKIIGLLLIAMAFFVFATAPTAPTLYGPVKWDCFIANNISGTSNSQGFSTTVKDTLVGADSIYLVKKYALESGCTYIVQIKDSCAAADTVKFMQKVYAPDGTTLMSSVSIDSLIGTNEGGVAQFQLTVGQTVFGAKLDFIAYSWISALKCLIQRFEIYKIKSALAH